MDGWKWQDFNQKTGWYTVWWKQKTKFYFWILFHCINIDLIWLTAVHSLISSGVTTFPCWIWWAWWRGPLGCASQRSAGSRWKLGAARRPPGRSPWQGWRVSEQGTATAAVARACASLGRVQYWPSTWHGRQLSSPPEGSTWWSACLIPWTLRLSQPDPEGWLC